MVTPSPSNKRQRRSVVKIERPEPIASTASAAPDEAHSSDSIPGKTVSLTVVSQQTVRPTPQECQWVVESLSKLHPHVVERNDERRRRQVCGMQDTIVDGVVSTILSQNTTSANSTAAFQQLKRVFPTWQSFLDSGDQAIPKLQEAIHIGGLAPTKSARIHAMISTLQSERGSPSLEYLRDLTNDEVKSELQRFKGLGPKTISCVLLFAMGRDEFPVDTHVCRISKQMGWIPSSFTAEDAYEHLNATVPDSVKLDLHCLLIGHGKVCHRCAARGKPQFPPKDGSKLDCPLVKIAKQKELFEAKCKVVVKKEC